MSRDFSLARAAIAAVFFVNGLAFATWVSRIPGIKESHNLSEARLSAALFALAAGTFGALPVTKWFIARFGSRHITGASALLSGITLPVVGWTDSFPVLVASLACFGAFMASMDVAMNSQASLLEQSAGRSIMSSFHGLWSLGGLAGSGLGAGFAAESLSPFVQFVAVCALLVVVSIAALNRLVRDGEEAQRVPGPLLVWPPRAVLLLGLVAGCAAVIEGGIADWGGVYLRDSLGSSPAFAALGFGAFSLTMMVGRFGGDRLIDRFGRATVLRVGAALAGATIAVALLAGDAYVALAAFALVGFGMSTVFPVAFSLAGEMRGTGRGGAIPVVATVAYGGQMLGPVAVGYLASASSLATALWLFVLMAIVIAALAHAVAAHARRAAHQPPLPPSSHF